MNNTKTIITEDGDFQKVEVTFKGLLIAEVWVAEEETEDLTINAKISGCELQRHWIAKEDWKG